MRKLKRSELNLAKQYGLNLGTCVMCKRKGVTSTYFAFKDPKVSRMFGLRGTHLLRGIGYIVDGQQVYEPKDVSMHDMFLHICKTCSKKHEDQRYKDENGDNPHGTPLTEEFRKAITISSEEWNGMVKQAKERHRKWKEQNPSPLKGIDMATMLNSLKPV